MNNLEKSFERDFREYLDASILHYEVTGKSLSLEDEIEWLKKYFKEEIEKARKEGFDRGYEIAASERHYD